MKPNLDKVAVIMGGTSSEREVSLMSGSGVLQALKSKNINAFAFDPAEQDLFELKKQNFTACFIALHGKFGEDGCIQGMLELLKIPYTGSGVLASSVAMDKVLTKQLWRFNGLPTPDWQVVENIEETKEAFLKLGSPMIVKPACEGSTIGLTKVINIEDCENAFNLAQKFGKKILCEEFIDGEELTCSMIELNNKLIALPIIQIQAPDNNYNYENKYLKHNTKYICPPQNLDLKIQENIQELVKKSFKIINCESWARVDILLSKKNNKKNKIYLLEINASPGMTSHSLVPIAAKTININYEELCLKILNLASLKS